jgi:K(+)-stimulated pyrophosphate-energized sodium pump
MELLLTNKYSIMNSIPLVFWLIPIASVVALGMAWFFFRTMMKEDEGTDRMKEIAEHVRKGAMAYLKQQYKVVTAVFVVLAIVFAFMAYVLKVQNPWVPFAFLTGGLFSGLAGFFGMKTATYASARTAHGARTGLDKGLKIAFRSGAVMGLVVVGLGLLDIAIWFIVLNAVYEGEATALVTISTTMLTFGMGASTQALFARVGGGIYTKAADVGADLVGKVEVNIPEDDPRNPATIADNVGDNVGDVAGMGADLYESYCGSILSTAALGATAFAMNGDMQLRAVIAPMVIAAIGIIVTSNNDKTFALCIVINIIRCQGCRAKSLCPRLSLHVARQGDVLLGYLYSLFRIDIFAISSLADGY